MEALLQIYRYFLFQHHMEDILLVEVLRHIVHQHPHQVQLLIGSERFIRRGAGILSG